MAFEAKFGSFNVITTGIGNTQAISGLGLTPKIVLFWSSGRTESVDAAGSRDLISMFGVGISSSDRRFSAVRSRNGVAASAGDEAHREDTCLGFTDGLGAFDGHMDVQSLDSDGFTLVVDKQMSVAYRVHFLALGGSDITDVKTGSFATRTGTPGSQANTSVGFQPDFLLLFGSRTDDATTDINVTDFANLFVGAGTGPGDDHVGYHESQVNGLSTMNTASYCLAGEILAYTTFSRAPGVRAELTSLDTNGFTLEYLEVLTLAFRTHYIAIKGGSYVVGDLLTETDTVTDIVESGFGFSPSCALFVSANKAQSTPNVGDAGAELSIGAFSSLTDRGAMVVLDEDAIPDSETATGQEHDAVYAHLETTGATAFPTVQAVNGGTQGTSTTSHTVNLPTGIQNGDLLFAVITVTGLPSTGLATQITWPTGWTELYERIYDDAVDVGTQSLAFRRADGTEGGSITVTTDDSVFSSHTSYRLTGHHATSDPEVGSAAVGNVNPDPPSLSPSWGAENTLWFAVCGFSLNDDDITISSAPTNYTNLREDNGGATGEQTSTGTARRELNSASENPGIFTLTTGRRWVANTIAIRPAAVAGLMDVKSVDSDGFTCIMDNADPSQFFVWYVAMGGIAEFDKVHSSDTFIQDLAAKVHSADVVIQIEPTDKVHSADAFVDPLVDQVHSGDAAIADLADKAHSADVFVQDLPDKVHSGDTFITGPVDAVHSADVEIVTPGEDSVQLEGTILFPIDSTQGYVRLAAELAEPEFGHVQLAAELVEQVSDFLGLRATLAELGSEFVKLAGTLFDGGEAVHSADVVISTEASEFVKLSVELVQPLAAGSQGVFPNQSYVKLAAWIVSPVPGEQSIQVPGTDAEDFLSSDIAQGAYTAISRFILDGIALIITQFTTGVISFQTRTRQWLRRIDDAPGGVLVSTRTQLRVLPNGEKLTIVTETKQIKDSEIVTVTTTHDTIPERVTIEITESNRFGSRTRREIQTITENGIRKTLEKRIVDTSPPTKDNIQPIRVRTLDGVEHFQWFGDVNPNFAGGDEEGTTITERGESIQPGQLNGQTIDPNGNPILMKVIDETVSRPDGSVQQTHTEIIGVTTQAGTTITDEEETFDGVLTKRKTIVTHPDGSQTITEVEDNAQTGISVEVETTNLTDENGRKTTTVVETTTETFFDDALGRNRTKTTRKTTVTDDQGSQTVDTTTTDRDNFEDDIVNRKIKVFLVQEFTVNCLIDTFSMNALLERQIQHQRGFAELELLGQQLGNADLTWDLRHDLITKFEEAVERIRPLQLQALGRTYEIVFAPSASAFRARYIVGTEPHVYELQLILHERSDIVTGLRGF